MGRVPSKLIEDAFKLPAEQRAALASSLIASLDDRPVDEDVEAAWAAEIARRIRRIDRGTAKLTPWPEVRRGILARIHGERHARVGSRGPRGG